MPRRPGAVGRTPRRAEGRCGRLPAPEAGTLPAAARDARILYIRASRGHMELVTDGVALPMLLRALRAPLVGGPGGAARYQRSSCRAKIWTMTNTMTMARFRRVAQLWNWLPGFRAVAEHENVHKAAHTLGISPSALSRTVKLLESAIGTQLFVRENNKLVLTALGAELLTITRNMMRQLDDCLAREEARRGGEGPLFIAAASEVAAAVVAHALAAHALGTAPLHVLRIDEDGAADELLRGNVDLVVAGAAPRAAGIMTERLGEARFGIYAAHGHPPAALESATFVATTAGPPVPTGAKVACYCDSIEVARTLCEASSLWCALPDVLVSRSPSLRRIADAGEPVALHASRRAPLSDTRTRDESRLAELVGWLRAILAEA